MEALQDAGSMDGRDRRGLTMLHLDYEDPKPNNNHNPIGNGKLGH
jgi:hypothetical protein